MSGEQPASVVENAETDLFVSDVPQTGDPEEDVVVNEVPIYLNGSAKDRLVLLQYPTRQKGTEHPIERFRLKRRSQVVQTDVETSLPDKYLDPLKLNPDGTPIDNMSQKYQGILKPANGRYAIGRVGADGGLRLSMVATCGQLRPHFAHQESARETNANALAGGAGTLRSVQLSAKSSSDQSSKYSGVLEFWKRADLEPFTEYAYRNRADAGDFSDEPVSEETVDLHLKSTAPSI